MITCSGRISEKTNSWGKSIRKEIEQAERRTTQPGRESWPQEGVGNERTPLRSIHGVFTIWISVDTESLQA